jgi:hypothetical protein
VQANSNDRKQLSTVCLEADKKEMNGDILMLLTEKGLEEFQKVIGEIFKKEVD